MSAPTPALPNVQLSFGPMLIGVFFNMILYGVLIGQVLTYYQNYRHDAGWMKFFVFALFTVETANTGFDMAFMYQPLIQNYGAKPNFFPTFFVTEPLCIVLVSTPIQLFFAWRIKSLTKSWWIPIFIAILAIASLTGGVWTAVMIRIVKTFANKPKLHNSALLWFLASCVADVLITVSLVFTLSKRKTGFSGTDSVIDKIIRMTIQTGAITSVLFTRSRISCLNSPTVPSSLSWTSFASWFSLTWQYFVWDLALSKLYTNCLMSTLNARQSLNSQSASGGLSEQRRNASHGLVVNPTSPRTARHQDTFVENTVRIHPIQAWITSILRLLIRVQFIQRHMDSSAIYELDTQKSAYDVEAGYAMPSRGDNEFGIQVTKVVERVKDPVPHPYTQ
ncbi:MFS domain-containing protein [Mycena venus]|uniref:MFS domain-containing protein n=1 Tax=Mycena venus TaxID=2733690 RepID=A0A8H6Y8K3_9AGAR|nr:MFS domain-containing protein [Mycena venus]